MAKRGVPSSQQTKDRASASIRAHWAQAPIIMPVPFYPEYWPTKDQYPDIAFCAGIMAGEGTINNSSAARATRNGARHLHFSVGMLDHWTVDKIAEVLGPFTNHDHTRYRHPGRINVNHQIHIKGGMFARIHVTGKTAEACVRVIWPWIKATDKGTQALEAFELAKLPAPKDWRC